MFAAERLRPLPPIVFPVIVTDKRTATRQALIDWRGNRYSVPPELAAAELTEHVGYEKDDPEATLHMNSRNGSFPKTVGTNDRRRRIADPAGP